MKIETFNAFVSYICDVRTASRVSAASIAAETSLNTEYLLFGRCVVARCDVALERRHTVVQLQVEHEHLIVEAGEPQLREFLQHGRRARRPAWQPLPDPAARQGLRASCLISLTASCTADTLSRIAISRSNCSCRSVLFASLFGSATMRSGCVKRLAAGLQPHLIRARQRDRTAQIAAGQERPALDAVRVRVAHVPRVAMQARRRRRARCDLCSTRSSRRCPSGRGTRASRACAAVKRVGHDRAARADSGPTPAAPRPKPARRVRTASRGANRCAVGRRHRVAHRRAAA